jgi:hypothetical protein
MILATWDSSANQWTKLSDTIWTDYHSAFGRPTVVYVPFDKNSPTAGRFYVAFIPANGSVLAITETEGNDVSSGATARRMSFRQNTMLINEWATMAPTDPLSLVYDVQQDVNVRALVGSDSANSIGMWAIADGLPNIDFRDFDDYATMRSALAGSLISGWP